MNELERAEALLDGIAPGVRRACTGVDCQCHSEHEDWRVMIAHREGSATAHSALCAYVTSRADLDFISLGPDVMRDLARKARELQAAGGEGDLAGRLAAFIAGLGPDVRADGLTNYELGSLVKDLTAVLAGQADG